MARRIKGRIGMPGDKSISHRALMIAAISDGNCRLENLTQSMDVRLTGYCLKRLGVDIKSHDNVALVSGVGFRNFIEPSSALDCGNSGTTVRLLTGLLAGSNVTVVLDGDSSLRRRPMKRVIVPLKRMGATIQMNHDSDGRPFTVVGQRLKGVSQKLQIPSAQVKTAILLAGLLAEGQTEIEEIAETRDHTQRMLSFLGVEIKTHWPKISLQAPEQLKAFNLSIPGDPSSAAFLMVAALLLPGSELVIPNLLLNPTRTCFIHILHGMGAHIKPSNAIERYGEPVGDVTVRSSPLHSVNVDSAWAPLYIDEVPILALAATQADGKSSYRGLSELRVKESDRLNGVANIINAMGGRANVIDDDLIVEGPTKLRRYEGDCHNDHRLAMMIEIGNLLVDGDVSRKYDQAIDISFKEFYSHLYRVLDK